MNFNTVKFESSYGRADQLPQSDVIEFVFAGRSNVGKSSMLNKIFNRKQLTRVSAVPGKTATINFYRLADIRFVDLPGYGYAKVSKAEKKRFDELLDGYFNGQRNIGLIFLLLDIRHTPSAYDLKMIDYLIDNGFPFVLVLTKKDKLTATQLKQRLEGFQREITCADQITFIPFSSKTGEGVEKVVEIMTELTENNA